MKILAWILLVLAIALGVFTVLPWVRSGWWVVRVCDFPRAQLGVACLVGAVVAGVLLMAGQRGMPVVVAVTFFGICAVIQAVHVVQFLPIWPDAVATARGSEGGERVRMLVSNLKYENDQHEAIAAWLDRDDIDLLVLVEVDDKWMRTLDGAVTGTSTGSKRSVRRGSGSCCGRSSSWAMRGWSI